MQAQLEIRRSPSMLAFVLVVLAATMLLGGALGYILKPAVVSSSPARVVVVHDESALYGTGSTSSADSNQCIWTGNPRHKDC